ncbi:MAG: sialate O-acetylesterase [Phycisphaerales bacterium]|jgi:alpha-galactosidase
MPPTIDRVPMHAAAAALVLVGLGAAVAAAHADDGPVKVFILAGQSNMVGAGQVAANPDRNGGKGSLEWLVEQAPDRAKYATLRDADGEWVERDDVKIWYLGRTGGLKPGFGGNENAIGPELGFGTVVGDAFDEPVVLVKIAWGGKAIGKEFRPPSSGGEVGAEYRQLVDLSKATIANLGSIFPEFEGREIELVGLGWHQGWNDRVNQAFNDAYEDNLSNLIRDLRKELEAPQLPFVIAETGMTGPDEKHPRALSLMAAQKAVAEKPEFRGTVAFVPTRSFWRDETDSPSKQGYHWNSNAETYYLIGESMGRAMLGVLAERSAPGSPADH